MLRIRRWVDRNFCSRTAMVVDKQKIPSPLLVKLILLFQLERYR